HSAAQLGWVAVGRFVRSFVISQLKLRSPLLGRCSVQPELRWALCRVRHQLGRSQQFVGGCREGEGPIDTGEPRSLGRRMPALVLIPNAFLDPLADALALGIA